MKQLLLSLLALYVCAASVAQDSVTAIQDDIFGLRIGKIYSIPYPFLKDLNVYQNSVPITSGCLKVLRWNQ